MRKHLFGLAPAGLAVGVVGLPAAVFAASVPYSQNFDGPTVTDLASAGFTKTNSNGNADSSIVMSGTGQALQTAINTSAGNSAVSIPIDGLTGGNFRASTTFNIASFSSTGNGTAGASLVVLANSPSFAANANNGGYRILFSPAGRQRVKSLSIEHC